MKHRAAVIVWLATLLLVLAPGCASKVSTKPFPDSMAQVETLRASGISWTNGEIRAHYNRLVTAIGPANEKWTKEGLSSEERARQASAIRHDARIMSRAMMSDPAEVEDLRKRDMVKYGNPDGPTFDQLVERNREKGLTGDAVYEAVVESSQRTDPVINKQFRDAGGAP